MEAVPGDGLLCSSPHLSGQGGSPGLGPAGIPEAPIMQDNTAPFQG